MCGRQQLTSLLRDLGARQNGVELLLLAAALGLRLRRIVLLLLLGLGLRAGGDVGVAQNGKAATRAP